MNMEIVYNAWDKENISDDIQNLEMALRFVEDEYIGGGGSRGYGKVEFAIETLLWTSIEHYRESREATVKTSNRQTWLQDAATLTGLLSTKA